MGVTVETPKVDVVVNGDRRAVAVGATLAQLLAELGAPKDGIAVEKNGRIVRRADHAATRVEAGDRIEIVTFVGGG